MDPETLSRQLAELHADLEDARELDPQSRQLLAEVLAGHPAFDGGQGASTPCGRASRSLADRLEKIAVQFEADHPTLAASSRRLIDLLGKAGL